MKSESELNTIIKNSLVFGFKIPDVASDFSITIAKAFDGFGVSKDTDIKHVSTHTYVPVYWESKFANHFKSFDLSRIEQHQIDNLVKLKYLMPYAKCWIIYGVKVARGDNRVFIFDDVEDIKLRKKEKRNFLKKELEGLFYYKVVKDLINLH
jgi:hypothetical protein